MTHVLGQKISYATVCLVYGQERAVLPKICKDIEYLVPLEGEIQDEQLQGDLRRSYLKEIKQYHGSCGMAPGRYMKDILHLLKKPRLEKGASDVYLYPAQHPIFRITIAAYYSVFHSYFSFCNENRVDHRAGFDSFLANKLRYMLQDSAKQLGDFECDIYELFKRETIKDRIKGNQKYFDNEKDAVRASLLSDEVISYLQNGTYRSGRR